MPGNGKIRPIDCLARNCKLPKWLTNDLGLAWCRDGRSDEGQVLSQGFPISFAVAAQFEDQCVLIAACETYYLHRAFGLSLKAGIVLLASWQRVGVHGQIEDDVRPEALRRLPRCHVAEPVRAASPAT